MFSPLKMMHNLINDVDLRNIYFIYMTINEPDL